MQPLATYLNENKIKCRVVMARYFFLQTARGYLMC